MYPSGGKPGLAEFVSPPSSSDTVGPHTMAQGYWEEGMPSSNPEGVAGRAPVAWRLSRTTCRSSAPRAARARWRGRAEWESERESERESRSGCEVLSQMQMERGAEGLRRVQRGRGAAGPRERRDHMPGGGTARTTRRRCHSCREWMRERSGGILLQGGGKKKRA